MVASIKRIYFSKCCCMKQQCASMKRRNIFLETWIWIRYMILWADHLEEDFRWPGKVVSFYSYFEYSTLEAVFTHSKSQYLLDASWLDNSLASDFYNIYCKLFEYRRHRHQNMRKGFNIFNVFYASKFVYLITAELRQLYKQRVNSTWFSLLSYVLIFAILRITAIFLRIKRFNTHFTNRLMWVKREKASTIKFWTPGKGHVFRVV